MHRRIQRSMWKKISLGVGVVILLIGEWSLALAQHCDGQAEQQLLQMLNLERARAGLPSLKVDDRLTQAARAHSVRMARAKQLSHQLPDEPPLSKRLAATNIRFNADAENVAYDYSLQAAHEGLMQSPRHRDNILSPGYNAVGIGVLRSGDLFWVTQDFADNMLEKAAGIIAESARKMGVEVV